MANTKSYSTVDSSSVGTEPETKVESVVPCIIYEEERSEDMAANLRVDFKERQCKRLFESITVISLSAKKTCMEILYPELVSTIAPTLEPSAVAAGTSHVSDGRPSFVGKAARLKLCGSSTGLA